MIRRSPDERGGPSLSPATAPEASTTAPEASTTLLGDPPSHDHPLPPPAGPISLGDGATRATPTTLVATLRVVAGRDVLRFAPLPPGAEVVIGRDDGVALVLSDPTVSRRHARVIVTADGTVTAEDLGSTNGMRVNGVPTALTRLRPGDRLEVGAVPLRLDLLSPDELAHVGSVLARVGAPAADPLTGLVPESWLTDGLPDEVAAARRAGGDLCALPIGVANLAAIRAAWGPPLAQDVLRIVARLVVLAVRDSDPCVRFGPEGILVVLHAAEPVGRHVADRVTALLAQHDWRRITRGLVVIPRVGVVALGADEPVEAWIVRARVIDDE